MTIHTRESFKFHLGTQAIDLEMSARLYEVIYTTRISVAQKSTDVSSYRSIDDQMLEAYG